MRHAALVAVLLFTGCANLRWGPTRTAEAPATEAPKAEAPKAEAPKAEAPEAAEPVGQAVAGLEFVSSSATKLGGTVAETKYSERADDAQILEKKFEDGVVTYTGQLGFGKGSAWAGFGFSANFTGDASPLDLGKAQTITFRLASATTRALRLRITGPDKAILNAGCYPIVMQPVTPELTDYEIPIAKFAPEGWCGPNARTIEQTAPQATGVEIVDIAYQRAPSTFSVGAVSVK